MLFISAELLQFTDEKKRITPLTVKLDELAIALDLIHEKKAPKTKLLPISQKEIQPVLVICPRSVVCEDINCGPQSLVQGTKPRNIPKVTLIKSTAIYKDVPVLTGQCSKCTTLYSADHERVVPALYFKIGQSLWVDRIFSTAVLNAMYSFHASSSAYVEFWNNSFGSTDRENEYQITRRQVWQSFVQESVRTIASSIHPSNNLELDSGVNINEVTAQPFNCLGQSGHIQTVDIIPPEDELQNISSGSQEMDVDFAPVTMVVVDGIVMGPTISIL